MGIIALRSTKVWSGLVWSGLLWGKIEGRANLRLRMWPSACLTPLRPTLLGGEWDGDFIRPTQLLKSRSLGNPGSFTSSHDDLAASVQAPTLYIRVVPG